MQRLNSYLSQREAGSIDDSDELEMLLSSCWHQFEGGDEGGMQGHKIKGRIECPVWNPPLLSFGIERHGAAALGSINAEVQQWVVNIQTGQADIQGLKRRQIRARDKVLNVRLLAVTLAEKIMTRADDAGLKWVNDRKVKVLISSIVPATVAQTTRGRRKRFWGVLEEAVKADGWERVSSSSHFLERQI